MGVTMRGRSISVLLGVALLSGCGQSYQPTVRRVSYHPGDQRVPAANPAPPDEDTACPGTVAHPRMSELGRDPKVVDADREKLKAAANARQVDPETLKIGVAGSTASAGGASEGKGREVRLGRKRLVAPATWTREPAPLGVTLAAFTLPRAQGDGSDAQLTVTPVGQDDPRSLRRLQDQLEEQSKQGQGERLRVGDSEIIVIESSGDSRDTSDPFPSPVGEGRYRALNATVFAGDKGYTISCTGPEKTVTERTGEIRSFLQSMTSAD
jgi:hypothetical protein